MNTPILLIAWRRPHTLRQVIDAIRPVAPTRLFVACDGPNPERPGETEKVAATRQVIETEIDWPCQVERLYSDVNQGCRFGPSRAITWFFKQVDEGIILEDDCIPHPDFFFYCTSLLLRYRDELSVWAINGNNFGAPARLYNSHIVGFVPLSQAWGWATWANRWKIAEPFVNGNAPLLCLLSSKPNWLLSDKSSQIKSGHIMKVQFGFDAWDYVWQAVVLAARGLVVSPSANLISNIGNDSDATHTFSDSRSHLQIHSFSSNLIVPDMPRVNWRLTRYYEAQMGLRSAHRWPWRILSGLKASISSILS